MEKEIALVNPYINCSDNERANFPLLAYYLRKFAVNKGNLIIKKYSGMGQDVYQITQKVNQWQRETDEIGLYVGNELMNSQQNRQDLLNHILKIFAKSDYDYQHDQYTKQTQVDMATVCRYLEMLTLFGQLEKENNDIRVYAKSKAVEIKKRIDNPELYPKKAQEQIQNNTNNMFGGQQNFGNLQRASVFNNVPTILSFNQPSNQNNTIQKNTPQPSPPVQQNQTLPPKPKEVIQFENPYQNVGVGFNLPLHKAEQQVQELCQQAISELDFDQFANAREALKLALQAISTAQK